MRLRNIQRKREQHRSLPMACGMAGNANANQTIVGTDLMTRSCFPAVQIGNPNAKIFRSNSFNQGSAVLPYNLRARNSNANPMIQYSQTQSMDASNNLFYTEHCVLLNSDNPGIITNSSSFVMPPALVPVPVPAQIDNFNSGRLLPIPINNSKTLKTQYSEPNLIKFRNLPSMPAAFERKFSNATTISNQSISITNNSINSNEQNSNQIILKSSFSDQNLQNNMYYELSPSSNPAPMPPPQEQNIMISNHNANGVYNRSIVTQSFGGGSRRKLPEIPQLKRRMSLSPRRLPRPQTYHCDSGDYNSLLQPSMVGRISCAEDSDFPLPHYLDPVDKREKLIARSHSLISNDQIIDLEYDSDTGWVTKNVRKNAMKIGKTVNEFYDSADVVGLRGSKNSLDRSTLTLDIVKNVTGKDLSPEEKSNYERYKEKTKIEGVSKTPSITSRNETPRQTAPKSPKNSTKSKKSGSVKGKNKKSKSNPSTPAKKSDNGSKFKDIQPVPQIGKLKDNDSNCIYSSSDSIRSIIDEVRTELLHKPKTNNYLSDETEQGSPQRGTRLLNRNLKKFGGEKAIEYENHSSGDKPGSRSPKGPIYKERSSVNPPETETNQEESPKLFVKCKSRSSSIASESNDVKYNDDVDDGNCSDDVFEKSITRGRTSSFHGKPNKSKNVNRLDQRRSSSLEAINLIAKFGKSFNRNSSVSINEKPEYFEYLKSPLTPNSAPSSIANSASNFSNSNCIALLQTTPKRASLKKQQNDKKKQKHQTTSSKTKSPGKTKNSSEYEVRDRGRNGNGNHGRDSFRQREIDRERDLSDRESQRDAPQRGQLNRSLSQTEGPSDEKIGKMICKYCIKPNLIANTYSTCSSSIDGSLSDTAVGLPGLDTARRKNDQRSPKSETTPTRERERFGPGMGKKSNSTSQLSATGKAL